MNIVFLSREYPPELHGGIGAYTHIMAQALVEAGHGVDVIAGTEGDERVEMDGVVTVHRIRPYLVKPLCQRPLRWLRLYDHFPAVGDWIGWSYAAYRKVRELLRHKRIDVIEAPDNTAQGYMISFLDQIPLIVKCHNPRSVTYEQIGHKLWKDEWLGLRFERWSAARATLITSPSRSLAGLLIDKWRLRSEKVHIIPNPIDETRFTPPSPDVSTEQDELTVLYVGSLGRTKGTRVLLDAMPQVLAQIPNAKLRLIGGTRSDRDIEDAGYEEYVARCWGAAVASRIEFVGRMHRDALIKEYQRSAIVVVPSVLFDNFPTVCLEAMSCGRPVVGTHVGGIPEIVADGVTGILVPRNNPSALADALVTLLANPTLRYAMGVAARQRVETHFAQAVIVQKTLAVYDLARRRVRV